LRDSKKILSLISILLFLIPFSTIIICLENHSDFKNEHFFPFFDGKVSISLVGRQFYNVFLFKFSFLFYGLLSILYYSFLFKHFNKFQIKNSLNTMGLALNLFLFIYLMFLGDKSFDFSSSIRRITIVIYIILLFIIHIRTFFYLRILLNKKKGFFLSLSQNICIFFLIVMSLFVIIGSPWVNPLIDYPYNLKNVIEWNFFLITILFYLPISVLLYNLKK
tara:strand:+ start:632 stop:1291 length:660 start_codon:yes stop_codon:yes gene_type:complete